MLNRSLFVAAVFGFTAFPAIVGATAPPSAPAPAQGPAASAPKPVCRLEGEIGEGRGSVVAMGARVGYRGEMTIPLAGTPRVVLKVISDFAPHKPAVDRISLEIGADGSSTRGLAGAFGERAGGRFAVVRTLPPAAQDAAWFEALMAGDTLTAKDGEATAVLDYPASRFEQDYDYLLDLLQLAAGWEIAGVCINRAEN